MGRLAAAGALGAVLAGPTGAADVLRATYAPLKAPECLLDTARAFHSENVQPAEPPHPSRPDRQYYLVARYMGEQATGAPAAFDFSRVPGDYGWPPARGVPLTNLAVPEPRSAWQRALRPDADLDASSAFQLHCEHAGSFINTWQFPAMAITGGGPHAIYGYSFNDPPPPRLFDADPGTDFVLQVAVEVPWFVSWPDRSPQARVDPIGQVVLFAYVRSRTTGRLFALLYALFDNRAGAQGRYAPFTAHDTATPFVSTPVHRDMRFGVQSPYGASYTGEAWSGLRFFRVHVGRAAFAEALAAVNGYCAAQRALRFCADAGQGLAFPDDPLDYELTDFGVLHEIFRGDPPGQVSMAIHVFDLGAWQAR